MQAERRFQPTQGSRQAEAFAWLTAILILFIVGLSWREGVDLSRMMVIFVVIALFFAASFSLGNWMTRHTTLTIKPTGVEFTNGLRQVSLNWDEIIAVQVFPIRFGRLVFVKGPGSSFRFQLASEIHRRGRVFSMGFAQGEYILQHILENAGLQKQDEEEHGVIYYTRP